MSLNKVWAVMCSKNNIILHNQTTKCVEADDDNQYESYLLNDAAFYQSKICEMLRRSREFNMKGYSLKEKMAGTPALFIACNTSHIMIIRENNTLLCVDNTSWGDTQTSCLRHPEEEVVFFQCTDQLLVTGQADGHVTAYNVRRGYVVEWEVRVDLTDVKCAKIEEGSLTVAILRGSALIIVRNGEVLQTMLDIGHFSWKKFLWDGLTPKHGIFENILVFPCDNELLAVSPKELLVIRHCGETQQYTITSTKDVTINPGCRYCSTCMSVYYFWPSILVTDLYICCRTSCSIRLYDRQRTTERTLTLVKVFPGNCSSDHHLPSDRCNLMAMGSKFLVAVDPFIFPRILVFDVESCVLLSTIGDDSGECDHQTVVPHRIYHMSYFVKIPSPSWLDGDFNDDCRPCLVTFKHGDYISREAVFVFHLEDFRVRNGLN